MEFFKKNPKKKFMFLGITILALVFFTCLISSTPIENPINVRLYTNNIRYDNKTPTVGEKPWSSRKTLISQSIENNTEIYPSVVCLQEVLHNQLEDILSYLNRHGNEWSYFGVGRTDGKKNGEYSPIFFRLKDWELFSSNTYWLSETPDIPSIGWDAALERIVTEVVLKNRSNGKTIKVLNTHFDHKGVIARRNLVKLILSKMGKENMPSFLCGDLNTEPSDEPYTILKKTNYQDSRTTEHNADENQFTFTGFGDVRGTIIDYIWADPKAQWQSYQVLPNFFGFYMSDHRPVIADYVI